VAGARQRALQQLAGRDALAHPAVARGGRPALVAHQDHRVQPVVIDAPGAAQRLHGAGEGPGHQPHAGRQRMGRQR